MIGSSVVPNVELPREDLRECTWWQPRTVAVLGEPSQGDRVQQQLLPQLLAAFEKQGHMVLSQPSGTVNLMLGFYDIPDTDAPLVERIHERSTPFGLTLMREYGLKKRPENLVLLVTIRERLSTLPHMQVIEIAEPWRRGLGRRKWCSSAATAKQGGSTRRPTARSKVVIPPIPSISPQDCATGW